jgi:hypothetical protein
MLGHRDTLVGITPVATGAFTFLGRRGDGVELGGCGGRSAADGSSTSPRDPYIDNNMPISCLPFSKFGVFTRIVRYELGLDTSPLAPNTMEVEGQNSLVADRLLTRAAQ